MFETSTENKNNNFLFIFMGLCFFLALFAFGQYTLKSYQTQYKKTEVILHQQNQVLEKLVETQQQQHNQIIVLQQQQQNLSSSTVNLDTLDNNSELGINNELSDINDDELLNLGDDIFKEATPLSNKNLATENNSTSVAKKVNDTEAQALASNNSPDKDINRYEKRLKECEKLFDQLKIIYGDKNAFSCYQSILKDDPSNDDALQGLKKAELHYEGVIEREIIEENIPKVKRFIYGLNFINASNPKLPSFRQWVKDAKNDAANEKASSKQRERSVETNSSNQKPDSLDMVKVQAGCDLLLVGEQTLSKKCIQQDFYIAKYEVTQKLWSEIMGKNPSRFSSCGENCPVENVSWFDIQEFIRQLNIRKNTHYRLPTEIEWEYAARAGKKSAYGFADSGENLYQYANFCDKSCINPWKNSQQDDNFKTTAPVGSFKANSWGIYDMQGNVWEWVVDRVMSSNTNKLPQHFYRGGSWGDQMELLKLGSRASADAELRVSGIGFRLAQSAE